MLEKLKSSKNKFVNIAEPAFNILLLVYAFLGTNCITFGKSVISPVMWLTFLAGGILILNRVLHIKEYSRTPFEWLLVAFLVFGCVSLALNIKYDLKGNFLFLINWAFYFILLYVQNKNKTDVQAKKDFKILAFAFVIIVEIAVIVSIIMLFIGYSLREQLSNKQLLGGFVDSRLYGLFTDPNVGATSAVVATVLLIAGFISIKKKIVKIFAVVFSLLNFFYVALSDSRTGMVVAGVVGFVFSLLLLIRAFKEKRLSSLISVVLAFVIAGISAVAPYVIKISYNKAIEIRNEIILSKGDGAEDGNDKIKNEIVKRDYDLSGDISNRRFSVWQSGFEIWRSKPIFGTTYNGFTPYAKENMPQTYIVNNDYMDMITFDNEIINILVSNGICGLVVFMIFAVAIFVYLIMGIKYVKKENLTVFAAMFSISCAIAVSAMFRSAVIYYFSVNSIIFWAALGVMTVIIRRDKEK